jgi:Zn-dependent protease
MISGIGAIFAVAVLILSVVIHEVSHGYSAYLLGDPTAKYQGRLTLNPLPHLEFLGSFLVPFLLILAHSPFVFGWAKPVPYNPYNLKNQKWGPAVVGAAGPASNLLVAVFFGLILRASSLLSFLPGSFFEIAVLIIYINVLLMVINLIPVPPLDGSKILFAFLPFKWGEVQYFLERFGIFILLIVVVFLWRPLVYPLIFFVFKTIAGGTFLLI